MAHRGAPGAAVHEHVPKEKLKKHDEHEHHPLRRYMCRVCGNELVPDVDCGCRKARCTCHYCTSCGVKTKFVPPQPEIRKRPLHH
jgi:hypothetical protein